LSFQLPSTTCLFNFFHIVIYFYAVRAVNQAAASQCLRARLTLPVSSVAREGRQGRTVPGGNQEGAAKMGVKFQKLEFLNLLSYVSAYEALYLSLIAIYDT